MRDMGKIFSVEILKIFRSRSENAHVMEETLRASSEASRNEGIIEAVLNQLFLEAVSSHRRKVSFFPGVSEEGCRRNNTELRKVYWRNKTEVLIVFARWYCTFPRTSRSWEISRSRTRGPTIPFVHVQTLGSISSAELPPSGSR